MRQSADRSRDPLIAVARAFLEGHALRHTMRAVAALDWEATVARAENERLAPILYVALRGGAAPAPILARLRASWMAAECQQLLAGKRSVGRFGAVDLGRGAVPGPKLAWLDRDTATLTLADDERGLATGREIAGTYGKKPLVFMIDAAQAKKYSSDGPSTTVTTRSRSSPDPSIERSTERKSPVPKRRWNDRRARRPS